MTSLFVFCFLLSGSVFSQHYPHSFRKEVKDKLSKDLPEHLMPNWDNKELKKEAKEQIENERCVS